MQSCSDRIQVRRLDLLTEELSWSKLETLSDLRANCQLALRHLAFTHLEKVFMVR